MFALWYLSLALDELRKRLGWTSIFDIFKSNKVAANNAIDNKPAPTKPIEVPKPKAPEPAKPVPVVQPEVKPTPPPKPVVKPAPVAQPEPVAKPEPPQPKVAPSPVAPAPVAAPKPAPTPAPEPAAVPAASSNGPAISAAESLDRKIFGAPKTLENGDSTTKPNVKAATTSFLEGEGHVSTLKQPKNLALRYEKKLFEPR